MEDGEISVSAGFCVHSAAHRLEQPQLPNEAVIGPRDGPQPLELGHGLGDTE